MQASKHSLERRPIRVSQRSRHPIVPERKGDEEKAKPGLAGPFATKIKYINR